MADVAETEHANLESEIMSCGLEGGGGDLCEMDRSKRDRECMFCKQVIRGVSADEPKVVSIRRERSARDDVDNKNLDTDDLGWRLGAKVASLFMPVGVAQRGTFSSLLLGGVHSE
jgi:hypothetical protein